MYAASHSQVAVIQTRTPRTVIAVNVRVGSTLESLEGLLGRSEGVLGTLGRYTLHELLAEGGMAEIYLAEDDRMRPVVVKRANERAMEDPELRQMFMDEARIASHLNHPNIVPVRDMESAQYDCYYVMDYLYGMDAGELLNLEARKKSRLPLVHALHIGIVVADALQAAYDSTDADGRPLGIVHRDVSPSNIHVGMDGHIHLLDFGIARTNLRDHVETPVGRIKGKFGYMAPEQMWGQADARSDVYSLAVVLWEMTTGRRLFKTSSMSTAEMLEQRHHVPMPSEVIPDYPIALEAIILKALSPDPDQRYVTAGELAEALEEFGAERQLPVSQESLAEYVVRSAGGRTSTKMPRLRMEAKKSLASGFDDTSLRSAFAATSIVTDVDEERPEPEYVPARTETVEALVVAPSEQPTWLAKACALALVLGLAALGLLA